MGRPAAQTTRRRVTRAIPHPPRGTGHRHTIRSRPYPPRETWLRVATWVLGVGTLLAAPAWAGDGPEAPPGDPRARERPRLRVELEAGAVWQSRNDVQIPNEAPATRFSLVDLVGNGPAGAARLNARWSLSERHQIGLLLAPLQLRERGTPSSAVTFAGETFEAGREVEATYRFNSWRVGYRYRWHEGARTTAWLGFTAKVRDAEIRIDQGQRSANDTDIGFVPLLHLAGEWRGSDRWTGIVEVEALGGGPGRAIDGAAKLRYGYREGAGLSVGYRTIEGGANVSAVYNFAWLHFAVVSLDLPLF